MKYNVQINGARRSVEIMSPSLAPKDGSRITLAIDGRMVASDAVRISHSVYSILLEGRSLEFTVEETASGMLLRAKGQEYQVEITDPRAWRRGRGGAVELEGRQQITAPMPGKIVRVLVAPGEKVENGQGLLVIEAMKMQNEIRSPKSGTVEKLVREGQTVNSGETLAVVV